MSLSTVVEWLNENEQRAYPLTINSQRMVTLKKVAIDMYKLVLDANFCFELITSSIKLAQISVTGTSVDFTIPGLPVFNIADSANTEYPAYVRNSRGDLLTIGAEVLRIPQGVHTISNVNFEPGVAVEIPASIGISSLSFNGNIIDTGVIILVEGYQTDIQINGQVIKLTVGRNEGMVLPCVDYFGSISLDCGDIVSFINGATPIESGGTIQLKAGKNIRIFEDTENSRIYIGLDFDSREICDIPTLPPKP